ncbi:hypothetical protein [Mesorhizobium sp. B2-3-10]|uniref:hypothetical protein n=1 Tax=Mesorhizobium sp. B2-3-10 TaxID=2589954 RepID=UPI00112C7A2B|nr:hypothetical protein [Mesorhizobium sp. B2-3-10]TPL98337.1 hypothetical protein FJ943_15650 [Mesorhizobium sp. B2-3-10]
MASNIRSRYAAKLAATANLKQKSHSINSLNSLVLLLPAGEFHLAMLDKAATKLPVVGHDVTLEQVAKLHFFDVLNDDDEPAFGMTEPFLVRKSHLEALERWADWKTLQGYLAPLGLEPAIVFRNTPMRVQRGIEEPFYVGDLRIMFNDGPDIAIS